MTRRYPIYIMLGALLAIVLPACNKESEDPEIQEVEYSSVEVESFALKANAKVLSGLDSVFFSIDLNNALIFNADSLPVGTRVDKLALNIGLPTLSEATLIESPDASGNRKEIDYLKNAKDSVNFSLGDVTLHLVSYDKKATRDYVIKVNVHKMVPDSLYWNNTAVRELPGNEAFELVTEKALELDGTAMSMAAARSGEIVLSTSKAPASNDWQLNVTNLPSTTDVATFTVNADAFFIVDKADGTLYTSADAISWQPTEVGSVSWIYGGYGSSLLYADRAGKIVRYPEMTVTDAPAGFPLSGTSDMITFESIWAPSPTAIMVGGVTADGTCTADTWAYDGTEWAPISVNPLPEGVEGVCMVPYFTFSTNKKTWISTKNTTLVAFGGRTTDGKVDNTVYISLDYGIRWKKADALMQLPAAMAPRYGAHGVVFNTTLTASRSAQGWTEVPSVTLSPWWRIAETPSGVSRAVTPITEWECPYIYMFGGYAADGTLYPEIWRGVINRLTFKPLQ